MFELQDLYLADVKATRFSAATSKSGHAVITFGGSEPSISHGRMLVSSTVELQLKGRDDDDVVAEIMTEYQAVIISDEVDWLERWVELAESSELKDFANNHLYPRHRERIMELTLRMGLPVFKLPLTLPHVEFEDEEELAIG